MTTISRGQIYGSKEGAEDPAAEASGAPPTAASPALFWIAAVVVLVVIRILYEHAD